MTGYVCGERVQGKAANLLREAPKQRVCTWPPCPARSPGVATAEAIEPRFQGGQQGGQAILAWAVGPDHAAACNSARSRPSGTAPSIRFTICPPRKMSRVGTALTWWRPARPGLLSMFTWQTL